jgi:hypothetical protein
MSANPQTAADYLKKISRLRPTLAIVLGSGFHHVPKKSVATPLLLN